MMLRSSPTRPSHCQRLVTALVVLSLVLISCSGSESGKKNGNVQPASRAVPVSVARVETADVPLELTSVGTVEPYASVLIKPQVTGILQQVAFAEGQYVKRGDLLFVIDQRPFAARVAQAKAALAKNQATLANARRQAERYQNAVNSGYVSSEKADQAETSVATLQATLLADEAALTNAQLDLDNCIIRAPLDGYTGALLVDEGNLVKASSEQSLVTINQLSPVKVSFTLPEQHLAEIRKHLASGELQPFINNPSGNGKTLTGKISFLDNSVDRMTGTIRLKADFKNANKELWPGQFFPVNVRLTVRKNVLVIPARAVQSGLDGSYVFVVADNHARQRQVTIEFNSGDLAVVAQGLTADEVVVTDGQLRLRDGARVSLTDPPSSGSPQ